MGSMLKQAAVINFLLLWSFHYNQYASSMHTYFCIRFPRDSFPDSAYSPSGDSNLKTVGMDRFPQGIWKKYFSASGDGGGMHAS